MLPTSPANVLAFFLTLKIPKAQHEIPIVVNRGMFALLTSKKEKHTIATRETE